MKIAMYTAPKTLKVEQIASTESLQEDQIRVLSLYSGISHGTEMNVYRGLAPFFKKKYDSEMRLFEHADENETWGYPIRSCDPGVWYLGYSVCGRVTEIGKNVSSFEVGDIVYINASHQSEHCIDAAKAVKLSDTLDPRYGIFLTNLLTAFNGILDSDIKLGDRVVVIGQGVIGQLAAQLARLSGASVSVVDMIEKRLEVSRNNGAEFAFNPSLVGDVAREIRELTDARGADVVIEASGSAKGLQQALRIVAPDSKVIALSWYQGDTLLNLADEFHHNRITIRCSQANYTRPEFAHMWPFERKISYCATLLSTLNLGSLITDEFAFDDIQKAYQVIDEHPESVIQSVLKY